MWRFPALLRLGVADRGLRYHNVAFRQVQIPECCASSVACAVSAVFNRSRLLSNERLLPFANSLCIAIVGRSPLHARSRLFQIGLGLLDRRLRSVDLRPLLAVIKACQNSALGDMVADIRSKIDQHAGNLEPDLDVTRASTVPRPKT